jgi:ABC-2 type transport system ATP-binding protein
MLNNVEIEADLLIEANAMKTALRHKRAQVAADSDGGRRRLPALANREPEIRPPIALRVDRLGKRYGATEAVAELSFDIFEGEVFGLLGPNGAGKTTTISMLATQRQPSAGDATLFGHSICKEPKAIRQMIGVAPQEVALYPMLSAAENLRFFGRVHEVRRSELAGRIDHLLRLVGLEAHRNDFVGTFSGGMQKRLNLAVALVHEPRLILLDEPTAGVDPQSREHIFEIIRGLRDAGRAILYSTHYMEEAEKLCDRLGIMDQGNIVAIGTLNNLMASANCAETIEITGLGPETDLTGIRSRAGVLSVERSSGLLRLHVRNAARLLEPLQQIISRSRKPVHLKILPPSLEQLFLQLTGKELRD